MYTLKLSQTVEGQPAGELTVYLMDNNTLSVEGMDFLHGWYSLRNDQLIMTISNPSVSAVRKTQNPAPYSATLYYGTREGNAWTGTAYGNSLIIPNHQGGGTFIELDWSGTQTP